MNLEDCLPGLRVKVTGSWGEPALKGCTATIVVAERPEAAVLRRELLTPDYPGGMVQVDLPRDQAPSFPCRSPWLDATDLEPGEEISHGSAA